ncbi:hypothetical protein LguiB_001679 [Lonicera macranthoides]
MYSASGKFSELPLIVTSSNLQFDLNNYNRKSIFGIKIKPAKNVNLIITIDQSTNPAKQK